MPIKEKKILSLRYLFRMVTYTMDFCLMTVTLTIAGTVRFLRDSQIMEELLMQVSNSAFFLVNEMTIAVTILAVICLTAFIGILLSVQRFIAHDLGQHRETRRLLSALGYRKKDIVLYEETSVLFDVVCAFILSIIVTGILWLCVKNAEIITVLCEILEQKSILHIGYYVITFAVVVLLIAWQVSRRVRKEEYINE